ncbi:hypothetical protein HYH03_012389 [Edaphochlamys debaryana]|uniref:SH3 domain-containing protein n=1 Tax=Edaphochlamys debaryana TaxID=47281 RepID=A0A836BVL0_9CHLO|nr:hypothetical protein HYH03_012389 [Edaphochlamys debaryana]|eukprot:KAG2489163.1 hypothetical protein HYH03_012389 [Edaphochlamys debaryana]
MAQASPPAKAGTGVVELPRAAPPLGEDPLPSYNNFIRATLGKGESGNYADQLSGLAALKNYDEKAGDIIVRLLARLLQFGHFNIAGVQLALKSLRLDLGKDEKALMRVVHYLVLLGLGDGTAGTPLPVPPQAAGMVLAKAVDRLGLDVLVAAWSDLGDEKAAFGRKAAALRALAAVTRASLTSRPEDGTYVEGLYETLRGLLDKMDEARAGRRGLAHFLTQAGGNRKKNLVADIRQRAEMWGLTRVAFAAARTALPRTGLAKIAPRSLSALGSSDPVCARHALALASAVARDPSGAGAFIGAVEPLLARNVEAAKRTGALHLGILPAKRAADAGGEDSESHLNLRDTWARVYLARACAAVIQSGHIAGDVGGRGAVFWQALLLLATADPSERVALEAVRALFGAPYPRASSAAAMRGPAGGVRLPGSAAPGEVEAESSQAKVLGASWHLVMTQALETPPGPAGGAAGGEGAAAGGGGAAAAAGGKSGGAGAAAAGGPPVGGSGPRAEDACVFGRIAARLMRLLQSRSHSLVCGAARAVAVAAESRAWFHALSGGHGHEAEPEVARRWMRQLAGFLGGLAGDPSASGLERAAAIEALVWCQGIDQAPPLTPGLLLMAAAQGGFTSPPIARYTFADPWPPSLLAELAAVLGRRLRCSVGLPPEAVLELAGGLAAGSPGSMPKEALQALWDLAPGPLAVRAALQLLSAPLPPLAQPPASAAVEVKALACAAEAGFNALKAMAACWLGEHINSVAGEYAWRAWEHKLGPHAEGEGGTEAEAGGLASAGNSEAIAGAAAAAAAAAAAGYGSALAAAGSGAAGAVAAAGRLGSVSLAGAAGSVTLGGAAGGAAGPGAGGAGGGGSGSGDDAVLRLAVAGVAHNPLLAMALAHLHRGMLLAPPVVRLSCAQALAKLAVRSGEPYRIQAYAALAAAVGGGGTGGGARGSAAGLGVDPLGLAPAVGPALELLDAMYAGELVLERHVAQYGPRARAWPAPALAALRRRHEWLLGAIGAAVCAVPRELFLPLGPRSRRLIYPDEKEEAEEEARAAAAAAAPAPAPEGEGVQYDEYGQPLPDQYQYDYTTADQDYGDYYGQGAQEGADAYGAQQDPLARYDFSGQKAAAAVELHWGGEAAYEGLEGADADSVAEARPGVVLYSFTAENEGEVSVTAGDHVRVLHDLGEWFQVLAPGGGAGLVPASYVALQDGDGPGGEGASQRGAEGRGMAGGADRGGLGSSLYGIGSASMGAATGQALASQSSIRSSVAGGAYSQHGAEAGGTGTGGEYYSYQYDNPEYEPSAHDGGGAYGSYYGGGDAYGGGQYGGGDQYGGGGYGSSTYGNSAAEEKTSKGKKGFGGFDDFGAVLAEAKTAAQQARTALQSQAAALGDSLQSAANQAAAATTAALAPLAASTAAWMPAGSQGGGGEAGAGAEGGAAAYSAADAWAAAPSVGEAGGPARADGSEAVGGGRGRSVAVYDFQAEMDGELSVAAGEELELLGDEVDGWFTARVATEPSRTGLIPASYVQLL